MSTPDPTPTAQAAGSARAHGLTKLFDLHAALLEENPYCYCEVAYTRQTGWMAWLCSDRYEDDSQRRVLARGQGRTPNEAAAAAVESFCDGGPSANVRMSDGGLETLK
jgi:hypothetical protein